MTSSEFEVQQLTPGYTIIRINPCFTVLEVQQLTPGYTVIRINPCFTVLPSFFDSVAMCFMLCLSVSV